MHCRMTTFSLVGTAAALVSASVSSQATGFDLPDQDAFAIARGMAFVATADNPSAVYYNPAGITQLQGHNVRGGVYGLHLQSSYESPAGGSFDNEKEWHAIPQLFYTYGPKQLPVALGLGVFSPFGLSSKWPQDSGFRTVATEGSLATLTFNPVVAWQIVPTLSVAAGLTVNHAEIDLRQGLTPVPSNDEFRFHGDDWDVGFNLGLRWQPHPKVSLGASYRSATTMNYRGYTDTRVDAPVPPVFPSAFSLHQDADAKFPLPQKVIGGVSYRPTPAWNFEVNVDWTDWNRLNSVDVHQASSPSQTLVLDWRSSLYYEFGATRYFGSGWSVSAGYIFNENSVPDAHYSPLVGDLDRHFFSAGVGYRGRHFTCDVAYQFGYGPTHSVQGSEPSAWGESADGHYEFRSHAVCLTLGCRL